MTQNTPRVFLDANILIAAGKPPGGPEIARVVDLIDAGLVTVLTTDLTISEVSKKHAANDFDLIKEICQPHVRKILEETTGIAVPIQKKAILKKKLRDKYDASTKAMLSELKANVLLIDEIKPSTIFRDYALGKGIFSGEGKRDQFPDAFAFECIKQKASEAEPVIIVSNDGDFVAPVANAEHITLVKSLPQLFEKLGLEMEAPEIDEFLEDNTDELVEAVDSELSNWSLQGDVEDSEIDDTNVSNVEIKRLTAFRPTTKGDAILVVGQLSVTATVSYTHPDWENAMYDSEDKILIPFEDVSGETEVEMTIDVSVSIAVDEQGDPVEIEELRFRNDDFVYVELHPYDPYE
jgi:predicted nucleic acid-binding protein